MTLHELLQGKASGLFSILICLAGTAVYLYVLKKHGYIRGIRFMFTERRQNKLRFTLGILLIVLLIGELFVIELEAYYHYVLPSSYILGPNKQQPLFLPPSGLLDNNLLYQIKLGTNISLLFLCIVAILLSLLDKCRQEYADSNALFVGLVAIYVFAVAWLLLFGWLCLLVLILLVLGIVGCVFAIRAMVKERKVRIGKVYTSVLCTVLAVSMAAALVYFGWSWVIVLPDEKQISDPVLDAVKQIPWAVQHLPVAEGEETAFSVEVFTDFPQEEQLMRVNNLFAYSGYEPGRELFICTHKGIKYTYNAKFSERYNYREVDRAYAFLVGDTCIVVTETAPVGERLFEEWLLGQAAATGK